jgi:ATP-binding cassette subfamily C protein
MTDEANTFASLGRSLDNRHAEAVATTNATGVPPRRFEQVANSNVKQAGQPASPASAPARGEAKHSAPGGDGGAALRPAGMVNAAPSTKTQNGLGGGGKGGGTGGGSGGGSGRGSPLEQRLGDRDFKQVLGKGLNEARRNMVVVAIFSLIVNTLVLAVPIYLFQMSDRVLTSRSLDTLVMLSIIVMVAIAAHVLLDMMRRFILMRVAVDVESRLGGPVLSAAAKAAQTGSNREFQTLADLQQIRSFITGPVILTMLDAPTAPIYLLAVYLIHPHLGYIVTVAALILVAVAYLNQQLTAVPFARSSAFATRANLQSEAMSRNSQVINAMGMIPEGVLIWGRETAESLKAQVSAQDRNIMMTGLSKFFRLGTQIAMLGWGAWLSLEGSLTGGMVIASSVVAGRALAPLEGTIEGWRSFIHARAAYSRVQALLQSSPLNLDRLKLPNPKGRLDVERILYVPPPNKKVILNGISFSLEPGDSLAIVGASGSGKSTLARMLVGSISPTAGTVRLDRMEQRNWDPRQFGASVGYLPQDTQLFPASIKANIARMQDDATDEAVFEAAEIADIHEMIAQFAHGYETQIGIDGSPLSGGQKQRLGLARAFFGNPRLVVLDEPNSNLDTIGENALARAFERAKARGMTVVAVTQRPALLRSVDKIMMIKDGAVQAIGTRDEILPLIVGQRSIDSPQPRPN